MSSNQPSRAVIESSNFYTFDPTKFCASGELVGWMQPRRDKITLNSTFVSVWTNIATPGSTVGTFAQGTAGQQPVYNANDILINGLPSITFDGVNDSLTINGGANGNVKDVIDPVSKDFLWMGVFRVASVSTNSGTSFADANLQGEAGGYIAQCMRNVGGTTPSYFGGGFGAGDVYTLAGSEFPITLNQYFLATYRKSGSSFFVQKNLLPEITGPTGTAPSDILQPMNIAANISGGGFLAMTMALGLYFKVGSISQQVALQNAIIKTFNIP